MGRRGSPSTRARVGTVRFPVAALLAGASLATGMQATEARGAEPVTVWHAYRGDEERALTEAARLYEAERGASVALLAIPFDAYTSKLIAAVPHAHGPDLFIEAHERVGIYRKEGVVAPVGDAFPEGDLASYDPTAVAAVTVEGVRFAVPLSTKCLALIVNEALLPKAPATLEDLAKARGTLPSGSYALAYDYTNEYFHVPFLHAFGGKLLDEDGHFAFHGEGAERSLLFVRGLARSGTLPDEPNSDLVAKLFAAGKAAAVISGPWFTSDLRSDVHYRVEPLPMAGGGGGRLRPYLTVESVFASPTGAQKPEVRDFARWLGGLQSSVVRATVGHQVVAFRDAWKDPRVEGDANLRAFHEAAKEAVPTPTSTAMRAAWEPAKRALRKVMSGDMEPRPALEEARHRFEDFTRPPPPPASPTGGLLALGLVLVGLGAMAVRQARAPGFGARVKASLPAYRYVAHAVFAVLVLVIVPLMAGAVTSLFAGGREDPRYVGLANYVAILTARGGPLLGHGSFYLTLVVTVLWTVVNVSLHVAIGLALGVVLSRPLMRLRAVYRVLLILPWAVPSYVTALAWKGMFHRQFGAVNAVLDALGAEPVSWFSHFATAFTANVATNVWLGFPFMMVVTMGALTSISKEVLEAAEVDGATRWQRFRLVTWPLVLPALLPSVILGAVWTFNMFNVVFLVSGGEPDGTTDILVSESYRWAFTRDAQLGYAAAYAVLIFLILAGTSRLTARLTKEATS